MNLEKLVRKNIWNLKPYSSARSEHKNIPGILLDANENSMGSVLAGGLNRYPDPFQMELKKTIASQKQINIDQIFIGNGSDEAIDLLIRVFCEPGRDRIIIFPPTYGVYAVFAETNDVEVAGIRQTKQFELDVPAYRARVTKRDKLTFICDPNNPSGNCYKEQDIITMLESSPALVVIDEAYIDFAERSSWLKWLDRYPQLVVLQTLSKAWGLAGIRLGMAYASKEVIALMNKIKYPYNINQLTQQQAITAIQRVQQKNKYVNEILVQRQILVKQLTSLSIVDKVFPSEANFLLVRFKNSAKVYQDLIENNILVRDRSNQPNCENCLRITIGNADENTNLIQQLTQMKVSL